jgi:hypothetical protein
VFPTIFEIEAKMHRLAICLLVFAVASCGSDTATSPGNGVAITGSYVLETINGKPLPYYLIDLGDLQSAVLSDSRFSSLRHSY